MISPLRLVRSLAPAIMLMAVVASFTGPSVVQTVRLLDGDDATAATSEGHLPLDMAAAPDQTAETSNPAAGVEGPVRVISSGSSSGTGRQTARIVAAVHGSADGPISCGRTLLCVYRL